MKFETGLEQKDRDEAVKKGKKLSLLQQYKSWNWQKVPELLRQRDRHQKEAIERQRNRIEELGKREERGELYTELLGDPKGNENPTKK